MGQLDDYKPNFPNARDCEHGRQRGHCADCALDECAKAVRNYRAEALRENALLLKVAEAAEVIKNRYVVNEGDGDNEHIICCFGAGVHPTWRALMDALAEWRRG